MADVAISSYSFVQRSNRRFPRQDFVLPRNDRQGKLVEKPEFYKYRKEGKVMKKSRLKKSVVIIVAVILIVVGYLAFSRPMTIQQRYPMLSLDKCSGIRGYYRDDTVEALKEFTIDKNSEEFELLCDLLYEQEYRRSLRDILPRGTRTHRTEPGDFQWEVYFHFDDIALPDGSIGSGEMLCVQCWYGELEIDFNGDTLSCYLGGQEYWAKEVLNLIR